MGTRLIHEIDSLYTISCPLFSNWSFNIHKQWEFGNYLGIIGILFPRIICTTLLFPNMMSWIIANKFCFCDVEVQICVSALNTCLCFFFSRGSRNRDDYAAVHCSGTVVSAAFRWSCNSFRMTSFSLPILIISLKLWIYYIFFEPVSLTGKFLAL